MNKVHERKSRRRSQKKLRTVSAHQTTDPDQLEKQLDSGIKHQQSGRLIEAETCYQQVLQWQPNHADAWHLLGLIAYQQEQYATAIERINRALQLNAKAANFHNSLGSVYQKLYNFDQALECYQKAIQLQPDSFQTHNNMGLVYQEQGQLEKAIEYYQQAIKLSPNYAEAHLNLSITYEKQTQLGKANTFCHKAIQLQPAYADAYCQLGRLLSKRANSKEATESYRHALEIDPDHAVAQHDLMINLLYYSGDYEPLAIAAEHRRYGERHAKPLAEAIQPHSNDRNPERQLRIGYVSGDFKTHSVAYFLEPLLAAHNSKDFEVICYANNEKVDATTKRLKQLADGWREIHALTDEQVAERVRQDRIDILVDLSGHTQGNRLRVFARKPAPVQVSYIGYPSTTGLETMDYRLTDVRADPEGRTEHLHTEQLIRLPHGFLCYQPSADCPDVSPPPVLQVKHVTFGSFNNLAKVSPELIGRWAEILKAVPDSRLIIKAKPLADPDTRASIQGLFQQHEIASERLELLGWLPGKTEHLALYAQVDIALDTFPYHGTTTTCEAMWMGVPVITQAGQAHVSRVGVSLLSSLGLEELIAESGEEYVQKAIDLANNGERLQELRANLRPRMQTAPLTNASLIARSLEDAYRTMWRSFCGQSPAEVDKPVVAQQANPVPIQQQITLGIQHHQSGQLQEAEACYQQVLQWQPDHANAWHLFGVISAQQKNFQTAIERISHAIELDPESAIFYSNLGNAYQERRQLSQAIECYQKVIELQPNYADAYQSLGMAYQKQGALEDAVHSYRQFLKLKPDHAEAYYKLGNAFQRLGNWSEAIECYQRVLQLKPDYFAAYYNLANVFKEQGKLVEAIQCYQKALQLKPEHPQLHNNLGLALQEQGALAEAIQSYQRCLQLKPDYFRAYLNLGNVCKEQGKLAEAIEFYQRALQLKPDYTRACSNLGTILQSQGKLTEAIAFFQRALQIEPQYAIAYDNLLFCLQYSCDYAPSAIAAEHRQWAERHAKPLEAAIQPHGNDRNPERQLRIGYISGDFNNHSVAYFLEPLLAAHNSSDCEVICYANNKINDATTQRLKQLADGWREIHALNDEQVAERVRQDGIDILVDLSGHTQGNRLRVFARKPAPVQASYIGYPSTTGLKTMDYRLTDVWADPEGQTEHLHTEQLIRLPHGFLCYQPSADCPDVSPPPVLQAKHVTFGSFNNLAKVNPELIGRWAGILKAVPDSRLIIKAKPLTDPDTRASIEGLFQQHEIAPERLDLLGWLPAKTEHLALYAQVDIALDTFPYHGTTTTCEALWMGVPVITQAGQAHVSRVGVSLLSSLGLEPLVAESAKDYVQKTIDLANNEERLQELRANLRPRMQAAPLTNAGLISQSVEHAYRTMWQRYCDPSNAEDEHLQKSRKLHIGGKVRVPGWEVLNALPGPYVDHLGNANDLSQFPDNTFSAIYASHLVEHLDYVNELTATLKDWCRVLVPGGKVYISVPDLDVLARLFLDKKQLTSRDRFRVMRMMFGGHVSPYDYHQVGLAWDFLSGYLQEAGFTQIDRVENFGLFDDTSKLKFKGVLISLNVIAQKPIQTHSQVPQGIDSTQVKKQFDSGVEHHQAGRFANAEACYKQVLQWQPNDADALHLLGVIAAQRGQYQTAIEKITQAIDCKPGTATFYSNLGNAYQESGQLAQAIECYEKVIQLQPDHADTYKNMGIAFKEQGKLQEAVQAYKQVLRLKPDYADAHYNLANTLQRQGKIREAISALQKSLQLQPDHANACNNLAGALQSQGKLKEAILFFQRALKIKPDYALAHSNLLFSLHYSDYEPSVISAEHRQWAERHEEPLAASVQAHNNDRNPERRLRIGYISGDFRNHSVAHFLEPLLAAKNQRDFEVICYTNNKKADATTERLRELADGWREIHALDEQQAVEMVRRDGIDILVDLSGHTKSNRMPVFARKPAPVQATYIGYPNTTGLSTMDYRLTDAWADPEGQTEHLHSEHLLRLPHGFLCYQPPLDCPEVSPSPVLQSRQITFGTFNNLAKVNAELIGCWAEILKAVPESRLILKSKSLLDIDTCDYVHGLFQQSGIEADRVELLGWLPDKKQHLALYDRVDIALDTFPYHGTTTTCEAMWMGVPVITRAGETHVSRVGVSLLSSVGVEEFIAESAEDYIQKAIELANNAERLQELRANLRPRMRAAPLTHADMIARSLEDAYRTMWRRFCRTSVSEDNGPPGKRKELNSP